MRITLLTVGKTDIKWVAEGLEVYASRLRHYISFEIKEIPELKNVSSLSREQIKTAEGKLILKNLRDSDELVLLDEHGKELRSIEFASMLERRMTTDSRDLVFAIRFQPRSLSARKLKNIPFQNDFFPSDGSHDFCRATLPCLHHHKG